MNIKTTYAMDKNIFIDEQRFKDKIVYFFLSVTTLVVLFSFTRSALKNEVSLTCFSIHTSVILIVGFVFYWLRKLRLTVTITEKKIKFKMDPFQKKQQSIKWKHISKCELVTTPYYARWNTGNHVFDANVKWISLSGRNGLFITTRYGEKYFIGSQNIGELADYLKNL